MARHGIHLDASSGDSLRMRYLASRLWYGDQRKVISRWWRAFACNLMPLWSSSDSQSPSPMASNVHCKILVYPTWNGNAVAYQQVFLCFRCGRASFPLIWQPTKMLWVEREQAWVQRLSLALESMHSLIPLQVHAVILHGARSCNSALSRKCPTSMAWLRYPRVQSGELWTYRCQPYATYLTHHPALLITNSSWWCSLQFRSRYCFQQSHISSNDRRKTPKRDWRFVPRRLSSLRSVAPQMQIPH